MTVQALDAGAQALATARARACSRCEPGKLDVDSGSGVGVDIR